MFVYLTIQLAAAATTTTAATPTPPVGIPLDVPIVIDLPTTSGHSSAAAEPPGRPPPPPRRLFDQIHPSGVRSFCVHFEGQPNWAPKSFNSQVAAIDLAVRVKAKPEKRNHSGLCGLTCVGAAAATAAPKSSQRGRQVDRRRATVAQIVWSARRKNHRPQPASRIRLISIQFN